MIMDKATRAIKSLGEGRCQNENCFRSKEEVNHVLRCTKYRFQMSYFGGGGEDGEGGEGGLGMTEIARPCEGVLVGQVQRQQLQPRIQNMGLLSGLSFTVRTNHVTQTNLSPPIKSSDCYFSLPVESHCILLPASDVAYSAGKT